MLAALVAGGNTGRFNEKCEMREMGGDGLLRVQRIIIPMNSSVF